MRPLLATLSAALVTGAVALTAATPAAAQDNYFILRMPDHPRVAPYYFGPRPMLGERREIWREIAGDILDFVCSSRGADALEVAFEAIDRRLELTAEQDPLFDDLRMSALVAQTDFADSCDAFSDEPENPVERMQNQQARLTAQLAAIDDVLPKLDAFYSALTPEQQAALEPHAERRLEFFRDRIDRPERPTR